MGICMAPPDPRQQQVPYRDTDGESDSPWFENPRAEWWWWGLDRSCDSLGNLGSGVSIPKVKNP